MGTFTVKEIKQNIKKRNEYRKEANAMYNNRMLAAHLGQIEYPKVRTFTKKFDAFSTNNVFKDLEQAEKWYVEFFELKKTLNRLVFGKRFNP